MTATRPVWSGISAVVHLAIESSLSCKVNGACAPVGFPIRDVRPALSTGRGPTRATPRKPLRAGAAPNRARVLEPAFETFAAEGLSVPIDEIARRAGVGAGTVYRHFPTKEDLFRAV